MVVWEAWCMVVATPPKTQRSKFVIYTEMMHVPYSSWCPLFHAGIPNSPEIWGWEDPQFSKELGTVSPDF